MKLGRQTRRVRARITRDRAGGAGGGRQQRTSRKQTRLSAHPRRSNGRRARVAAEDITGWKLHLHRSPRLRNLKNKTVGQVVIGAHGIARPQRCRRYVAGLLGDEIGYLMEDRTNHDSGSCHFTSVSCQAVVSHQLVGHGVAPFRRTD
ncbi:hypothetical protein EVAR_6979_1 [Eumeta japonica]|uniref:Uncharacterized protein n=1 Tax=Eumeta variegata TaxID=151549 RepID=A0A4C1TGN3_EUMVA|nr:hypothetical protein EVAR_6979_1 [Eumeta japonica]